MSAPRFTQNQSRFLIGLGLVVVTLVLYWPVSHHDFINVDDPRFVTQNEQVQAGLTWPGVVWAFKSVYTEAWQPVTWLSHMLDCQMYGLNAGKQHVTSLWLHIANVVLLFLWLENLTRATWRSAFVAALFAWHPLHVESVAWICERKDVLSAFFWLLALMAYTRYVRKPGVGAYALVLGLFALGLMSKPMVVTLPCVLLLLDFWPFNRLGLNLRGQNPPTRLNDPTTLRKAAFLLIEKIPFFILVLAMTLATLHAQKAGGSLASLGGLPLQVRVANALVSYLSYLSTTFWPTGLAFFYPYSFHLPLTAVLEGALLLLIWTGWFLKRARLQPYLLMGWFWFLGTLVPTIGLVQFCIQAKADRYTYIPSIGLFLVVVWGLNDLFDLWPARKKLLPVLGGLALAGCLVASSIQLGYWQNSVTVARHAIEVTDGNYVAYESLGESIAGMGQPERATNFFAQAVRFAPNWPQGQFNYGITLADVGETNGAIEHLAAGVKLAPDFPAGRARLAHALLKFGRTDEAVQEFSEAMRLQPSDPGIRLDFGEALQLQGKFADAVAQYREALRLRPGFPAATVALDRILSAHPDFK